MQKQKKYGSAQNRAQAKPLPAQMTRQELADEVARLGRQVERLKKSPAKTGSPDEALKAAIIAAKDEQARSEAILAGLGVGVIIQSLDYKVEYENAFQQGMVGRHVGEQCYKAYENLDGICPGCPMVLSLKDGAIHKLEREIQTPGGSRFYDLISSPLKDSTGAIIGGIKVVKDVTDVRRAQKETEQAVEDKAALLLEIHHRVKNNMQIISSIIRQQIRHTTNPETTVALNDIQDRIHSMALVHDKLFHSKDFESIEMDEYIRELTTHLMQSFNRKARSVRLTLDIEPVRLLSETAVPCGIILNEAISNSFKYAFHEGHDGTIHITLKKEDWGGLLLSVSDNGAGLPEGFDFRSTATVGFDLITILAEQQLRGDLRVKSNGGTTIAIRFKELEYKKRSPVQ